MNRLVDDLLSLARAEADELVYPQPVDLGDFLHDLERDLPLFGEPGLPGRGPARRHRSRPIPSASPRCSGTWSETRSATPAQAIGSRSRRRARRARRILCRRHRARNPARPPRADIRPLLPHRRGARPGSRRQRPGAADRARDRRGPRGPHLGAVSPRGRRGDQVRVAGLPAGAAVPGAAEHRARALKAIARSARRGRSPTRSRR